MQVLKDELTTLMARTAANAARPPASANVEKTPPQKPQAETPVREPAPEQVIKAVDQVNAMLEQSETSVRIKAADLESPPVIQIVDQENDEVIRQIPAESVVKLAEYWSENGLLADGAVVALAVDETA
ncbi:MAG: flagellar protein FlaG [Pseudomonadota bacterium]